MRKNLKSSFLAVSVLAALAAPAYAGLFGSLGGDIAKESTQIASWALQAEQMIEEIRALTEGVVSPIDGKFNEQEDIPLTWQDVVKMQEAAEGSSSSVYQEQLTKYEEFVKTLDESMTQEDEGIDGGRANRTYNMNQREVKVAYAAAETIYDSIQRRTKTLEKLEGMIGNVGDGVRGAVDLNSRIQLESSYIQTEIARLNAIHQRLTAAQLNHQTQGYAKTKSFFISSDKFEEQQGQQQPNAPQGDDMEP